MIYKIIVVDYTNKSTESFACKKNSHSFFASLSTSTCFQSQHLGETHEIISIFLYIYLSVAFYNKIYIIYANYLLNQFTI